jgi:hypothetical protein
MQPLGGGNLKFASPKAPSPGDAWHWASTMTYLNNSTLLA